MAVSVQDLQTGTIATGRSRNVAASDTATFEPSLLRVRTDGTLVFKDCDGKVCDYGSVTAGEKVFGLATGVMATGTSATVTRHF